MTTYPRELHSYRLRECSLSFREGVSVSRNARGKAIAAVEDSDPYLTGKFATPRLTLAQRHPWEAWKDSLRGGLKTFLAYDISRAEPLAYPNGVPEIIAATWDGEGTISTLAAHMITAEGAPEGFVMTAGDHIGLVEDGKYGVFRVADTVTAGATTIAVAVNPAVPLTIFTSAATVVFRRPKAEFVLLGDSWSNDVDIDFAPISFEAVQKL